MKRVEKALLDILRENNGEAYQTELVRRSGFSRSRVSEVLSKLQTEGFLSRFPLGIGKNFNVVLHARLKGNDQTKRRKRTIRLGFTRAAEYPYIIPFRKLLKDKLDLDLDLKIYENGIDVTRDLSLLRLDLGISPVLTQFMFFSLGSPIKIVAPAGSGGSSLLVFRRRGNGRAGHFHRKSEFRIASTKLSTMELLMRSSVNEEILPKMSRVVYTSSPEEIIADVVSRKVDAVCMWEPYATILLAKKRDDFSRLIRYTDIGEHLCCGLAAGNHLDDYILERVRKIFLESLEQYTFNPGISTAPYAALTGFNQKLLDQVRGEYSYPMELNANMISHQLERAGLTVPTPLSVKEAISVAS